MFVEHFKKIIYMKKFLFSTLMLLLLSCATDSLAQSFHRGEVPRKPKRSAKVDVTNKRKPTGKPLKTQQQMFEEFSICHPPARIRDLRKQYGYDVIKDEWLIKKKKEDCTIL